MIKDEDGVAVGEELPWEDNLGKGGGVGRDTPRWDLGGTREVWEDGSRSCLCVLVPTDHGGGVVGMRAGMSSYKCAAMRRKKGAEGKVARSKWKGGRPRWGRLGDWARGTTGQCPACACSN
eukprot:scaffold13741_cov96-Isochrysis_galbana.AAC.4